MHLLCPQTRNDRWIDLVRSAAMAAFIVIPPAMTTPIARDAALATAMHDGDTAFQAFDNETARVCYERAFAMDSTSCDVLWKLARSNVDCGIAAPKDDRPRWFASGERLSRRCVALYPDSSEAHFFLAVAIGQMTKVVGNKRRIELSREVKDEAEAVLLIDPAHAGAMHILGRWNYEVAGLGWFSKVAAKIVYGGVPPGASYQQAKEWFERAIVVRPDMPLNHLWLGETLIKLDDYVGAREQLQICLALGDVLWDDSRTRAQAQKRLHDIEGKK
jgi:tetratricopeptide (TPR) repeat protein